MAELGSGVEQVLGSMDIIHYRHTDGAIARVIRVGRVPVRQVELVSNCRHFRAARCVILRQALTFGNLEFGAGLRMLIEVTPYQNVWPHQFQEAAARIRAAIGDFAKRIDHIGSTAVPGLAAKPVIDLMVSVADLSKIGPVVSSMEDAGFVHRPEAGRDRPPPWEANDPSEWKKVYFRTPDGVEPRIHAHFREMGRRNQRYALLFRDYLRSSEHACESYGLYKQLLGGAVGHLSAPGGTGPYLDLKDPVLDLIADAAEKWAAETGWRLPEPD